MNIQKILKGCDFIDFGSGRGGCINFARKKLGGKNGLAIEINKDLSKRLSDSGIQCICGDVTRVVLPRKSVRFVTMSHFLEHLDSLQGIKDSIKSALNTATDFVFIEGPSFDFDAYLLSKKLKFFWYDGCGHKTRLATNQLIKIFREFNVKEFDMLVEVPFISNSKSKDLLPVEAPDKQLWYDPTKHPSKKLIDFDRIIYRSFIFFLWLRGRKPYLLNSRSKFSHWKLYHYA